VINGEEQAAYNQISYFDFSPDGQHVAYAAKKGAEWVAVVDTQEGPAYDFIAGRFYDAGSPPFFSPDSQRVVYWAFRDKKAFVVLDEQESKPVQDIGLPNFSWDSKTVAYVGEQNGKASVILDGEAGKGYDTIGPLIPTSFGYLTGFPVFSPDSKHIAYTAKEGDQWFVVIDGNEGQPYDYIFRLLFASDAEVHYIAQKGPNVYFVAQAVE
jgi:Tol biopolymer transport system component